MRSTSWPDTVLGRAECRQVRTVGTASASPAGTAPAPLKKRKKARMAVTSCPQLIGCSFDRFTTNELHDRVPAEALPFNLGIPKTLLQQSTRIPKIIATTPGRTA
jgi:hypothetical protein